MAQEKRSKSGVDTPQLRALMRAVVELQTPEAARRFFVDLCTPQELASMAERWRVAQLVAREVPYRAISEETGVSTATITRVARAITYGSGGYQRALERAGKGRKSS